MAAYLDHTAVPVADIDWSVNFFQTVFGMKEKRRKAEAGKPVQIWLNGGLQLVEGGSSPEERGWDHHLGIVTENWEETMEKALRFPGVQHISGAPAKWLSLPDGLIIELFQGKKGAVAEALSVDGIDREAMKKK